MVTLTPRKSGKTRRHGFALTRCHCATISRQSETVSPRFAGFPRRQVDKFKDGLPAAQGYRNHVVFWGEHACMNRTVYFWLQRFSRGDTWIEERRAGPRKSTPKSKLLTETVKGEPDTNARELAERLQLHYSTGSRYFAQIERWKDKNVFHPMVLISVNQTRSNVERKNCDNNIKEKINLKTVCFETDILHLLGENIVSLVYSNRLNT
ncbi:hypothetical protein M514_26378 [Trichuris suis]|uniref:Mos1 transposase HTH domain-containing protein n=1 Tax=Trichuris suis TaxID=68888 RepID=A0A085MW21_9BILA|nr:hypothetical protein M514_26378 [Trichuris suis]